jgi:pimeloyl-ACP methyl ester carboxylesterase
MLTQMRSGPAWPFLLSQAHTLPYDVALSGGLHLPPERLATVTIPTLVINGDQSQPWMQAGTQALAAALPTGHHQILAGQDHGVLNQPAALQPLLTEFFG